MKSLINENHHNSRASSDIDMELSSLSKIEKMNTMTLKKSENEVVPGCNNVIVIFECTVDLKQFEIRIEDASSVILILSLITTLYLTKS